MHGRAPRGAFFKLFAFVVLGGALAAPSGCTVGFTTGDATGAGSPPPIVAEFDASTADDAAYDGGQRHPDGAASLYQGSPLCNYSNARSLCDPDAPIAAAVCAPSADAGASGDAGAPTPLYGCHVDVPTLNAPPTQSCAAPGRGQDGDACQHGSDCAPGFECVGAGVCRHYCCDATLCERIGKLSFCDVQTMSGGATADTRVPVCMPVQPCKLLLPGYCDSTETCAPVRGDGTTSCVAIGPARAGESCDRDHCAKDLACLGASGNRLCYQLCHTDATGECPSGTKCRTSSAEFVDPTIGVCQ